MSDPRLAGRKKAVLVLSYGLRALSPEGPSGSVPEGGEGGDSIPGLALGISCTLRFRRRTGLSVLSSAWWAFAPAVRCGPRPASRLQALRV